MVIYKCDEFFNCDPPVWPWYPKAKMAQQFGKLALWFTESAEQDLREHLGGIMYIERVPTEQLAETLRVTTERLYRNLRPMSGRN